MPPGTYTLLVELPTAAAVEFGARGEYALGSGWYAYTGSAFGPGGLQRVDRHRGLAAGESEARHWHVDYLLGHPESRLAAVYATERADVECGTARALNDAGRPLAGLGASDCDCTAHLAYAPARGVLAGVAADRHETEL